MSDAGLLLRTSRPLACWVPPLVFALGFLARGWPADASLGLAGFQLWTLSLPLGLLAYGVNDLYDVHTDRRNAQKAPRVEGAPLRLADRRFVAAGGAAGAGLLLFASALTGDPVNWVVTTGLVTLAVLYSAPPIRLKEIPLLDCAASALGYLVLPYALGFAYHGPVGQPLTRSFGLIALCVAAIHAFASIRDIAADRAARVRTTGTWLGSRATALLCAAVFLAAAGLGTFRSAAVPLFLLFCAAVCVGTAAVSPALRPVASRWGVRAFGAGFLPTAAVYLSAIFRV